MSTDTPLWSTPETAQFWPADYDRIILDETDSTMLEAARRVKTLNAPTWIMARRQTQARGRRGRPWSSLEGNFAATLVMRPNGGAGQAALRSFLAALALRHTLAMCIAPDRLSLKWPNDVLLDSQKVAGILLESFGTGAQVDWLGIGFGVNLVAVPPLEALEPQAVAPVSVAGQGGRPHSQDDMLFWLASHFADEEKLMREFGFGPIRTRWLTHAARRGRVITARTPRDTYTGTFADVDADGQLVLETKAGRVTIPAGDVYF